jgi:hypothetical protein
MSTVRTLTELIDECKGMSCEVMRRWYLALPKEEQEVILRRYVYLRDQHSPAPDFLGDY